MEREFPIRIDGASYTLVSDDDYLAKMGMDFEPAMVRVFKTLVRPRDMVLDIGANLGCTAILFSRLARHVHVFEPAPTTFEFLRRNVENSKLNNVALHNVGLGREPKTTELTYAPRNRAGGFVSDRLSASKGHVVERISIDVLDRYNLDPDFIKIDTEGFEHHVLAGAAKTLKRTKPVVVLEMNHWCLNAMQRTSVPDFLDFLRSQFPILLAVEGEKYRDLHDQSDAYRVMYEHILRFRFSNLVGAFENGRLREFQAQFIKD